LKEEAKPNTASAIATIAGGLAVPSFTGGGRPPFFQSLISATSLCLPGCQSQGDKHLICPYRVCQVSQGTVSVAGRTAEQPVVPARHGNWQAELVRHVSAPSCGELRDVRDRRVVLAQSGWR